PNKPEYSLISVLPASISASGVTKVKDPSPLAVQPVGSKPPTSAQSPRFALLGKKSSSTVAKSLSSIERWRSRKPIRIPNLFENWYCSWARLVFSDCFRNRLLTPSAKSAAELAECAGVPATPSAGVAHG